MNIHVIDQSTDDPAWDAFLAAQPAGRHLQSCPWGHLKSKFGWRVIRILANEAGQIVGGAQLLTRPVMLGWNVGYISKGPVVAPGRADVMDALMDQIERVGRAHRLLVLSIQPPADEPLYMRPLQERHFEPSSFYVVPSTTVVVDLQQSEQDILAQMKQKTRYNIRLAARKGVVIREGNEADLSVFWKLTEITGSRSADYTYFDLSYYQEAWQQFAPRGMLKMWLAYCGDEPIGSLIAIAFGQWSVYKWGASSNAHRDKMPNNLLQWTAIQWGREKQCRYYDLGGISPGVADALRQGEKPREIDSAGAGVADFKLGFGQVVSFPDSYDNNYGIRPRWMVRKGIAFGWNSKLLRGLVRGARTV
jgi:lipid II:glycine glycyltransferase (peptidoglycan interpeptide bridge formation enzyme)